MFPRLPRVVRLALLLILSLLSLLLLLWSGQDKMALTQTGNDAFVTRHRGPSGAVHGLLPSTVKFLQLTSRARMMHMEQRTTAWRVINVTTAANRKGVKMEDVKNPHNFRYLLNPRHACHTLDGGHVNLLIYVHSAPANFKKRQSIRQTWGDQDVLRHYNATLVFIMGSLVNKPTLLDLVKMESERYGDIVQEDFVDSYRNLTYKAVAGLKWAATYCSRAVFILKSDDDILINLHQLVKYIRDVVEPQHGHHHVILCNQWLRMKIIREKKSKWYIPEEEFPGEYFPPYCSGSAFLLSGDMALAMYQASLVTPFFWVDDYYITGALIKHLGVTHKRLNQAYSLNPSVAEGKYKNDTKRELFFFHLHKLGLLYRLWRNMTLDYERQLARAPRTANSGGHVPSVPRLAPSA